MIVGPKNPYSSVRTGEPVVERRRGVRGDAPARARVSEGPHAIVDLSEQAAARAKNTDEEDPAAERKAFLEQIAQQVRDGTYEIDAKTTAESMLVDGEAILLATLSSY